MKKGKIAGSSITAAKMTNAAIGTATLQDGSVTNSKLGAEAVTGDKANESTFSKVPRGLRTPTSPPAPTRPTRPPSPG